MFILHSTQCDICLGTSNSLLCRAPKGVLQASGRELVLLPVNILSSLVDVFAIDHLEERAIVAFL